MRRLLNDHGLASVGAGLTVLLLFSHLSLPSRAGSPAVRARFEALPGVDSVRELVSPEYPEKYVMRIRQEVDPLHHDAGTFEQRIVVCHVGWNRPTVLVTDGYDCDFSLKEHYTDEVAKILGANIVAVQYRYFKESTPHPTVWRYLTMENACYDLHHIRETLGQLYTGNWAATGISKGGQTALSYRVWFPGDVRLTVPYVAPLCKSDEDRRLVGFIQNEVSRPEIRQAVRKFQIVALQRREALLPAFGDYCRSHGYTFRIPMHEVYDYCVLELAFAFWQWGMPVLDLPTPLADDSTVLHTLIDYVDPGYFSLECSNRPFIMQACTELGYYSYDLRPFRRWISLKTTKRYMERVMLPEGNDTLQFDDALYRRTMRFLRQNDLPMIFIYGNIDPWSAVGVRRMPLLSRKRNIRVYTLSGGSHKTRIANFPKMQREEIKQTIRRIMAAGR